MQDREMIPAVVDVTELVPWKLTNCQLHLSKSWSNWTSMGGDDLRSQAASAIENVANICMNMQTIRIEFA